MNKLIGLASFAAIVCAGCGGSDTSTSTPTSDEYDAVAQSVGSTAASAGGGGDTGTMIDTVAVTTGSTPLGFVLDAQGHLTASIGTLDYDLSVSCMDANGTTEAVCVQGTTDKANVSVMWSGALDVGDFSAMVQHSSSWSLTGLTSSTATLNGTGSFTYDSDFTGAVDSTYHLDLQTGYNAVAIAMGSKSIIGGEIDYDVSAKHTVTTGSSSSERDLEITAVLDFHADGTATLLLDDSRSYTVDMSTGVTVAVSK